MTDAFETNMKIIAGKETEITQNKQLSDADKKILSESYFKLFFNLTYTNWLRGKTLGESWYVALRQIEQFVISKNGKNSAALYVRQIFAAHKAKWSQVMMTNKHRDDVLQPTPEQQQLWNQRVAKNVTDAMNSLNSTLKEYEVPEQKAEKQSSKERAIKEYAQKIQTLIMLRMKQNKNIPTQ